MAFILSSTSHEYIQHVAHSIGFGGQPKPKTGKMKANWFNGANEFEDDEDDEDGILDLLDAVEAKFPNFFPPKLLSLMPAAQKSLVLLKFAQPDHAMLTNGTGSSLSRAEVRWLWRIDEVEAAWKGIPLPSPNAATSGDESAPLCPSEIAYKPEISEFRVFDLQPWTVEFIGHLKNGSTTSLTSFISSFPPSLPAITPTLSSLVSLTFQGLTEHASTLSAALLHIFVDQPGTLNFYTHLVLLRDFLLVSKPEFKSKLIVALFEDGGEFGAEGSSAHSLSVRAVRKRQRERHGMARKEDKHSAKDKNQDSKNPWAVGLAHHLLERETWPPVGADLAFYLRTVIVDSLDWTEHKNRKSDEEGLEGRGSLAAAVVLEEAEWRLGFAIKDLPEGSGKDRWTDPLCT